MDENGVESIEELHFFYDAQSRPAFVEYDGAMYRYVHNLQDDIVAIVDAAGNRVVEYRHALRRICRAAHFGQDMSPYDFCGNAKEDASGWLKPFPDGESAG